MAQSGWPYVDAAMILLCLCCRRCGCCWLRFTKCLQEWKQKLQDIGYEPIVFEDPLDMLLQQVQVRYMADGGMPCQL